MEIATPGGQAGQIMIGVLGGRGLFSALVDTTPRLWSTDGTVAGTAPLRNDVEFGSGTDFAFFQGRLYFAGADASGNREPWQSDGTPGGTQIVADLSPTESSSPFFFRATDDVLAFNACTATGCELHVTNGFAPGVERVPGLASNDLPTTDGSKMYFKVSANHVFVTDGTLAGTVPFLPLNIPFAGNIGQMRWFAGAIVMTVSDDQLGPSIWRSDGTTAGSRLVADLDPGTSNDEQPGGYFPMGQRLFFTASQPTTGTELWMLESNRPNANDDSARTTSNTAVRVAVLANDSVFQSKIDASSIEIFNPPQFGDVIIDNTVGEIVYTPDTGSTGVDWLQYRVRDLQGELSNAAFVSITTEAAAGPGPGTPPPDPPPPPPPTTPPGGGNDGGGGGGTDFAFLFFLLLLLRATARNNVHAACFRSTAS